MRSDLKSRWRPLELVRDESESFHKFIQIDEPVFVDVHCICQIFDTFLAENIGRIVLVDEIAGVTELLFRYLTFDKFRLKTGYSSNRIKSWPS